MLSKTSTSFRRTFARVAVAGALVTVPLGALAVTASAAAPDSSEATVQAASEQIPLEGADIARHPDRGPGDGPRVKFRGPGDHRGDGPQVFQQFRPPTGSAGSS